MVSSSGSSNRTTTRSTKRCVSYFCHKLTPDIHLVVIIFVYLQKERQYCFTSMILIITNHTTYPPSYSAHAHFFHVFYLVTLDNHTVTSTKLIHIRKTPSQQNSVLINRS